MPASNLRELLAGETLVTRELEVLALAAEGYTTKDTAKEMFLGIETIRVHRKTAIAKLNAKNITHATCLAVKAGLI